MREVAEAIMLLLVGGTIGAAWMGLAILRQQDRAVREWIQKGDRDALG